MKKLIAILAIFALVTSAVFAQADFSAGGAARAVLLSSNTENDDDGDMETAFGSWFWVGASKTNDDGTAGAKGSISIATGYPSGPGERDGSSLNEAGDDTWFYAWWQPVDQLFIKLGKVGEDGKYWEGAGILAWDFQSNDLLISPDFQWYNGFAGGLLGDGHGFFDHGISNYTGLQVSLLPMEGLAINLGWSFEYGRLDETYSNIAVQGAYSIPGAGTAAIGFRNYSYYDAAEDKLESAGMQIAAQYKQQLNDDMKIEVGIRMDMSDDYNQPLQIGVGFGYGSPWGSDFWTNVRLGVSVPMEDGQAMVFGLDVCPSIDMGAFRLYVPVGIAMLMPDEGDSLLAWSLNPYIRMQMGGLEFWAGLKLYNGSYFPAYEMENGWNGSNVYNDDSSGWVNFAIPIAILWAW